MRSPVVTHRRSSLPQTAFLAIVITIALVVVWSVLHDGIPYLRHDWRIADDRAAMASTIASMWEPWLPAGIGEAQPYPTFFLVGFALAPLAWLPPVVVTAIIVGGSIAIAAYGAASYARGLGAPLGGVAAAAAVAALNPWVYSKEVAGHIIMVLAYGFWWLLVAELSRERPRPFLPLLAALAVTQIEFLVIGAVPLVIVLVRKRAYAALFAFIASALPISLGIFAEYGTIHATPYLLPWQIASAVPMLAALTLRGYEFSYDRGFDGIAFVLAAVGAAALAGLASSWRAGTVRAVVAIAVGAILYAGAATSALAPLYAWLVLHVVESGLFREQYDLIAAVAVAYGIGVAHLAARHPRLSPALALAALAFALPWIATPVASLTVPASALPLTPLPPNPAARVALLPAFQPVTLGARGSGFDPDAVPRANRATPLNSFLPAFPVDRALARLQYFGDDRDAAALGAIEVIARPALRTNEATLVLQSVAKDRPTARVVTHAITGPTPVFGAIAPPAIVALADDPAADAISAADPGSPVAASLRMHTPPVDRSSLDPARGWVDLRLAGRRFPLWSNPYGGAITRSTLPLATARAGAVLAGAVGTLTDDRSNVVTSHEPPAWHILAPGTLALRCTGVCGVIAFGEFPHGIPAAVPRAGTVRARKWHAVTPWLVLGELHGDEHALRYAVRYNSAWLAWDGRWLAHGRLAEALNVWWVDPGPARRIVLIEATAAGQSVLEIVAAAVVLATVASSWRRSVKAKR